MHTSRWKKLAIGSALYLGAVALGLGSAWWVLKKSPWMQSSVVVGAWKTDLLAGNSQAGLYTRAVIAVNAALALDRSETMYFMAVRDDNGRPLRARCSYRVVGTAPPARWWSVTAYAQDLFLFDAPNQRYSINSSNAPLDALGQFQMQTGAQAPPGVAWIPTPGSEGLVLVLRLYNPHDSLQSAPASLQPPRITPVGDCP